MGKYWYGSYYNPSTDQKYKEQMFSKLGIDSTVWSDQQRNNMPGRVFIVNIPSSYTFTTDDTEDVIRLQATKMSNIDYWIKILTSQD